MTPSQLHFLLELLMTREERQFLSALRANPTDQVTRNEYIDYLIEQGRDESAELIRLNPFWSPLDPRGEIRYSGETELELKAFLDRPLNPNPAPPGMFWSGAGLMGAGITPILSGSIFASVGRQTPDDTRVGPRRGGH